MTVAALPLFKMELSYQVKRGRRWTALEHLVLWAVAQDARNLAELGRGCAMPQRLVVEALINLLKVGWIELTTARRATGDAVLFTANGRGRAVLAQEELPYAFDLEKRHAALYVDRLTAHLFDDERLLIRHVDQIEPGTLMLAPEHEKYDASPARFFESLPLRPDDQFERPLDHRITSLAQYAMLDVIGEQILGLPEDAPAQLTEVILRRMPVEHWAGSAPSATMPYAARPLTARRGFSTADVRITDILLGGRSHRLEMKRMLAEAKSVVYVHSTFIGRALEDLIPDLVAAAERDVDVILLWGERKDADREEPNQSEIKGRLAHSKIPPAHRERVRLAQNPTGSHAKIILADSGSDGRFEAVVGSCNWLSADYSALELSVRLREPRLVQEVAGVLADMSRPPSGAWGRDVERLLRIEDRCRRAAYEEPPAPAVAARAMLISDEEHHAAVRDVRNASAREVRVGCDLFGPAGQTTVLEPLGMAAREDGTKIGLLYNRPTESFVDRLDGVVARYSGPTITVVNSPGLHGKFLAWDEETLVVTSFNWLAASTRSGRLSVGELGVLIRDRALVQGFLRRIAAMTEPEAEATIGPGTEGRP